MELKEISATHVSPYRCYVRGNIIQTEGENVKTIGFKDGIAVLQVIPPDMQNFADNMFDSKAIDLTKLKKIIVKIDPKTGKKYIHKDGKKVEILPQISPIFNTLPQSSERSIFIKTPIVLNGAPTMKVLDNVKYRLLSMKKGGGVKAAATMTEYDQVDKGLQTDSLHRTNKCTQTDLIDRDIVTESFVNFILEGDGYASPKKMIDLNKIRTKEEMQKFSFFNDMNKAMVFDRSGNLPIHDSVITNDIKAVQKNCVVLRAIKESVNILNQSNYTPLHLAILYDVSIDIVKVLLHHDADVGVPDSDGNTVLHLAIEHGRSQVLKVLINGALESRLNLDVFNYEGFTPLILAVMNQSYPDAQLLLQSGADPNVKDMKSGRTALFHAAEIHDVDLVDLLMRHRADTKIRNFFGTSPHDAMFELEDIPIKIKFCILGRDHQRFQKQKKPHEPPKTEPVKKAKLETTPVLKKVTTSDLMPKPRRK